MGAGCSGLSFDANREWCILDKAAVSAKVPGRQTVCRAEAWAVYSVLVAWSGSYHLTIATDASYSVSGMSKSK